jgi:hypothetical protein
MLGQTLINMTQLEKLQLDYSTHKSNYNRSNEFSRDRHYNNMQKAWDNLKQYKLKNCPELLEQPKRNTKPIPFTPMDTWCEIFENYNF